MNDATRIVVKPNPGVTPEEARDARVRAWRFVFDCWEQKKTAGEDGGEGREEEMNFTRGPPQA